MLVFSSYTDSMMGILPKKCPECGSEKFVVNSDGKICRKCGLVVSENYYSGKMLI